MLTSLLGGLHRKPRSQGTHSQTPGAEQIRISPFGQSHATLHPTFSTKEALAPRCPAVAPVNVVAPAFQANTPVSNSAVANNATVPTVLRIAFSLIAARTRSMRSA